MEWRVACSLVKPALCIPAAVGKIADNKYELKRISEKARETIYDFQRKLRI